jgi:uncharacterized protein YcfJ
MKKTVLALAAAGWLPLAGIAAPDPPAAPTPPAAAPPAATTPAPATFEPKTRYGDVARVLSSQPVYERAPYSRRECRIENTGYNSAASEVPPCDDIADARERIVAYGVTYQYMGRDFRIRLPYEPGEQIAVNVEVRPPLPERPRHPRNSPYRGPY